jgi:hypothetical protein
MTDEERQKLIADLRRCKSSWLEDAADEIEALAALVKRLKIDLADLEEKLDNAKWQAMGENL